MADLILFYNIKLIKLTFNYSARKYIYEQEDYVTLCRNYIVNIVLNSHQLLLVTR